jgi:phosphoserine aminotransferase
MKTHKKANYLVTGAWSEAAAQEAAKFGTVNLVSAKAKAFQTLPDPANWAVAEDADYFHYCENETVHGVEINNFPFDKIPKGQTIVCDMSSNFCSREIEWTRYGVVYAGIQKNLGPAGVCVVVIREDLIGWEMPQTPLMCSWKTFLKAP